MLVLVGVAERSASTGATRVADQAGTTAATTVTTTPTSSAATTVRGSTAAAVVGTSRPIAPSRARIPVARPTPPSRPMVADTRPIAAASTTMPPSTWRRVAPTERSSATSRRRWATSTLKVFQMTKEPTNTETAAKTSRMFVNMPRPSRTAAELSSASSRPVSASDPAGRTAAMSSAAPPRSRRPRRPPRPGRPGRSCRAASGRCSSRTPPSWRRPGCRSRRSPRPRRR